MLVEANKPVTVRTRRGDVKLQPGRPIQFPDDEGRRLLRKFPDHVREVPAPDWLAEWRELAALTDGLTRDDPRLVPVLDALQGCDDAFLRGNYQAFLLARTRVSEALAAKGEVSP